MGQIETFDICAVANVIRESLNRYIESGENINALRSDRRALRSQNIFLNFAGRSFR